MPARLDRHQVKKVWEQALDVADRSGGIGAVQETMRAMCRSDLFFLLFFVLGRADVDHDWLYDRICDVVESPNGRLDLWAREHRKSTIITFGLTIQDILRNPEVTIGIFSHTRPIAKAFLRQIKVELEGNSKLKDLFPDVLWQKAQTESPKWSEDDGIIVKRQGNPKESTVEAWGLVDGQPTGRHFDILVYDDVVVPASVTTPEQIKKVTEAWELSQNLTSNRFGNPVLRYVGTRYHFNDTYDAMMKRGVVVPRIHPATEDGQPTGKSVLFTQSQLIEKARAMGPYTFACQMLLDPRGDDSQGFRREWLRYWDASNFDNLNIYLLVDPANEKKKGSDYSAFCVVGLGPDMKYYVINFLRDRLDLRERTELLLRYHQLYRPIAVGYEKYGKDGDIQHIEYIQSQRNYRFEITALGGSQSKLDRIRTLSPLFSAGDIYLPTSCPHRMYDGRVADMTQIFVNEEYMNFPVSAFDDMLDCLARIRHPEFMTTFPINYDAPQVRGSFDREVGRNSSTAWNMD